MTNSGTLPKRRAVLERPKQRAQVIAMVLEGKTDAEIATALKVSRQAVTAFRHRHADELAPAAAEVEKQIIDYAIAHKVNRIAGLDALANQVQAWIDDHGLAERSEITTENAVIVRERFAREVPAELRAIYRAAAEELNDLPRGDVNIQDNRIQVLVRQYGGFDPSAID